MGAPVTLVDRNEKPFGDTTSSLAVSTPGSAIVTASVTRPADTTAYAIGDLIANNTTAGSVTPLSLAVGRINDKTALVRRMRLKTLAAAWKGAIVRVHLFRNQPTVTVGDNGQLNNAETYAFTESEYMGYQDVTLTQLTSDNYAKGFVATDVIAHPAAGTKTIYALLEARSATTPASGQVFTLALECLRD